jgi:hypothetical protein
LIAAMPIAHRLSFAAPTTNPREAKAAAARARDRARNAGTLAALEADRLWVDALIATEGQPRDDAAAIWFQAQHALTLICAKAKWPRADER